jgi:hypothetical protein
LTVLHVRICGTGKHWIDREAGALPAEIVPCDAVPVTGTIEEPIDLVEHSVPHHIEYLQNEIDFLLGRNYTNSANLITSFKTKLTMPLDSHILGVVHSSPVKVMIRVEPFKSSQINSLWDSRVQF